MLTSLLSAKLAAALAVGAVSAGGVAVAAYSGALPVPAQNFAHHAIGAPAAHKHEKKDKPAKPSASATADPSATPTHGVGPDATGPAAFGLCQAFNKERTHGKVEERSVAFRNLATAAGGADKIAAYCATIPHPSADPSERPDENASEHPSESSEHPTGKPTELPNPHSSGHAKGKPSAGSDEGNQD